MRSLAPIVVHSNGDISKTVRDGKVAPKPITFILLKATPQ